MKKLIFTLLIISLVSILTPAQFTNNSLNKSVNILDSYTEFNVAPDFVTTLEISIGDSLTNGHQDANPSSSYQSYPHILSNLLAANSYKQPQSNPYVMPAGWLTQNGSNVTVVNFGIEGQKLEEMIANFNFQSIYTIT